MRFRLFPTLVALFVGLPLADTLLLVFLGQFVGFWQTVGLVILSGFLGAGLAKREGLQVFRRIQQELAQGIPPSQGVMDAALILTAGGMLAAPGFLTDILGLALLFPRVRAPLKALARKQIEQRMVVRTFTIQ
ncbi:MAG: FxsA family protein [Armatimonadetes bacterium]|nr:FxsA family protein [Armatimonadota bacterium]